MRADDWILMSKAPERVKRGRSTIYRWVQEGKVRKLVLQRSVFLNVSDLLNAERIRPGRPPAEM